MTHSGSAAPSVSTGNDMIDGERAGSGLADARTAEECLTYAAMAEQSVSVDLQRAALDQAVALDRNCLPALLSLAVLSLDQGDRLSASVLSEEAARITTLPDAVQALRAELFTELDYNLECGTYLRAIGR